MQPFQLFSCSGSGIAAMAGAAVQLWQLSSSSNLAITAQQQQQLSYYSSAAPAAQQFAALQPCSHAALQPCSHAALRPCSLTALQPNSPAAPICSLAARGNSPAALQPYDFAVPMKGLKI